METLLVKAPNGDTAKAIKAFLKTLGVPFEKVDAEDESPYNPEFVAKIKHGQEQIRAGKSVKISLDDLWK